MDENNTQTNPSLEETTSEAVTTTNETPVTEEVTPTTEPVAPVAEEATPTTEPVAPATEEVTPATEPVVPTAEPVFPSPEPVVSAFETTTPSEPVNAGTTLTEQRFPNATKSNTVASGTTLTEQRFPNSGNTSNDTNSYYSPLDSSAPYTGYVEDTATVPKGMGIASLVLGIIGLLATISCCLTYVAPLPSILGIIFGCIQKPDVTGKKPGVAVAGIITSAIGLVLALIIIALSLFGLATIGNM